MILERMTSWCFPWQSSMTALVACKNGEKRTCECKGYLALNWYVLKPFLVCSFIEFKFNLVPYFHDNSPRAIQSFTNPEGVGL